MEFLAHRDQQQQRKQREYESTELISYSVFYGCHSQSHFWANEFMVFEGGKNADQPYNIENGETRSHICMYVLLLSISKWTLFPWDSILRCWEEHTDGL